MKSITFYPASGGGGYSLFDNSNKFLTAHTGFGGPEIEAIGEPTPYHDGVYHRGLRMPANLLTTSIEFAYATAAERVAAIRAMRVALSPFKNRTTPGYLRIQAFDDVVFKVDCFLRGFPSDFAHQSGPYSSFLTMVWYAPEASFYTEEAGSTVVTLEPTGSVTFGSVTFGTVTFSGSNVDQIETIAHPGDIDTYPTIVITSPGSNPIITNNTTGKLIAPTVTLDTNDTLTITMGGNAPSCMWYDASGGTTTAVNISTASSYWPLVSGQNEIRFQMTSGLGSTITLTAYWRYSGIV